MKLIYRSTRTNRRSAPIDEADTRSRQQLESRGWTIVERIGEPPAEVFTPFPPLVLDAGRVAAGRVPLPDLEQSIWAKLYGAGYEDVAAVAAASDDDLLAIDGIGPATLAKIREAI